MKRKIIPLLTLALLFSVAACGNNNSSSEQGSSEPSSSEVVSSSETVSSSEDITSSEEVSSSEAPSVTHVESVSLTLGKTSLYIGDTTTATVDVLPSDADDKSYSLTSSNTGVATVSNNEVTAVGEGTTTITVTSTDGQKTASVELTVTQIPDPEITIVGEKTLTVAAGTDLQLPTVSAKDYLDNDLSTSIEIEDLAESGTINDGVFNAKIAGQHKISYYVEDKGGRYAEEEVVVNVTPANAENFDVTGYNDPSLMSSYGTFKENFEKGKKSPLMALNDSNNATYLTATSEAISGNSLIIDMNKTAGSAANSVFLSAFNDYFKRDEQATYKVSFKYKVLTENNNHNDVYFGLSWDGSNGLNNQFTSTGAVKDQVYEYSCSFPGTSVPATGNAYFFFFKLSGSSDDIKIAIDDFTVETVQLAQVTAVEPTAAQLESGFTWDFATNGATSTNGETVIINNLENETAKAAMKDSEYFSANALKLINADGHLFSGLTKNNMTAEKQLDIEMIYYAVNDGGFHLIMMGDNGNPTLSIEKEDLGNGFKKVTYSGIISSGWNQLNIYGAGNSSFEIYVGSLKATLSDAPEKEPDTTNNGHKVGDSWTVSSRQWGNEDKGNGLKTEAFDGNADAIANEKMGSAPTKFTINASNVNMEWFQAGGKIETGHTYTITLTYYVASWEGSARLMYNFDNSVFLDVGSTSVGFHEETITWTATKDVDFFSLYFPDATNGVVYVASANVTLKRLAGTTTANGHSVGDSWTVSSRQWGNEDKGNGLKTEAFDGNADAIANEKMGSAPTKFTIEGANVNMEWFQAGGKIEEGNVYEIACVYYVASWEGSAKLMYNFDNSVFLDVGSTSVGFHEEKITWTATKTVDFFSFYFPDTTNGVVYVASVTVTLVDIA